MPELPEVETVRRGLTPHLVGRRLIGATVRESRMRWPVPDDLAQRVADRHVLELLRRGKYLLFRLEDGWLICHLGMSGSLRLMPADTPLRKHDHVDFLLEDGQVLRYHDPRRFGALLWSADPAGHPLIAPLGVEPLADEFDGARLHDLCRGRSSAIKQVIMDSHRLVGVGNIYANEALFAAGIDPRVNAECLSRPRCARLAGSIKTILTRAIEAGGSTLRDFVDGHGNRGWFQQTYQVYGRAGQPCLICGATIRLLRQNARASYFCPTCQHR
jgi:formamidopyrimidine-DNA glycosylase